MKNIYSYGLEAGEGGRRRRAILAMVEQGGFGAEAAAPIARHVIEDIYHLPNNHQGGCAVGDR